MRLSGFVGIALANLVLVLALGCSSSQEKALGAAEEAREAISRGDRSRALAALEVLRENKQDTPEALIEFVELLAAAGETPQVVWLLEEGVRRFPDREDLRLGLANAALLVGNSGAALAALRPIGSDSEHHMGSLLLRSRAQLALGDLDEALTILEQAENLYPDDPRARLARVVALMKERRTEEARSAFDEARVLLEDPQYAAARLALELSFLEHELKQAQGEQEIGAVIDELRALLEPDRSSLRVWRLLLQAYRRGGRSQEAIEMLESAIRDAPESIDLQPLLPPLLASAGRHEDAEAIYRERVEEVASPTDYVNLARFLVMSDRREEARELLEGSLGVFPENPLMSRLHAEVLLDLERLEDADRAIARHRSDFPGDPAAEYLGARLDLARGDTQSAITRLTNVMPRLDESTTQYWLAKALEADKQFEAARRRYNLAVLRNPQDPGLYAPLIKLAEARGDWVTVASLGSKLVRLAPSYYEGWVATVAGFLNLGEAKAALELTQACVKIFKDKPEAQLLHAQALGVDGQLTEALSVISQTIEAHGTTAEIEAERATILGMSGKLQEGAAVAQQALATSPNSAALYNAYATLLFGAGQAEAGSRAVDRALSLAPDDLRPLATRARFNAATGRLEAARADCERYLEVRPDDAQLHFILGVVLAGLGRDAEAIEAYRRVAEIDPFSFAARNNLALLLADSDLDAALAAAQEAYSLDPESADGLDTLGWLYLRKDLVGRATALLEKAHTSAPENADAQLHLALAYRDGGRVDEARELLADLEGRAHGREDLDLEIRAAQHSLP